MMLNQAASNQKQELNIRIGHNVANTDALTVQGLHKREKEIRHQNLKG